MRNPIVTVAIAFLICVFCDGQHSLRGQVITASSCSVDVLLGGERFSGRYAVYQETVGGITNVNYSAIILMPHGANPDVSVGLTGKGTSVVTTNGENIPLDKRRVCRVNARGTILSVFAGELPLGAYDNENGLKKAVTDIIAKAEQGAAANESQPFRSGTHSTPQAAGSRR